MFPEIVSRKKFASVLSWSVVSYVIMFNLSLMILTHTYTQVPPEAYLSILLPHVRGDRTANTNADTRTIANATLVLSAMCQGTLSRVLLPHTNIILSALEDVSRELGNTMSSRFRLESFRVLNTLTTNLSNKTQAVIDAIFTKRGRLPDLNHTRKRMVNSRTL